jgi:signal-transduction protein with cAMP-binding, CBS, and nucleotidyltransferase domain
MPIGEFCKLDVVCVEATASIAEVAGLMREHHVGDVIVLGQQDEARIPAGIVTDRDIVISAIAPGVDLKLLTAGDIMHTPLTTIRESAGIFEALQVMRNMKIRRLPVVREDGTLYGIITADDLIAMLTTELSMISRVVAKQPAVESRTRP